MQLQPKIQHLTCPNPKGFLKRGFGFHQLHYMEWGDENAEKTVICVHGLTRNAHDFDYLACALAAEGFRVICPDVVGRGKSDWLPNAKWYGYPLYVADIMTLLTQLQLADVHWVGTSMGGLIGMMVETSGPHVIDKMVLNDIGPFIPKESLQRIGSYVGQRMQFDSKDEAERYFREIHAPFGVKQETHWQHMLTHSLAQKDDGTWHLTYDPALQYAFWTKKGKQRKLPDLDLWNMWSAIHCPMLVLRGAESDLLQRNTAQTMAERDNVELVEFDGIGHAPMLMEDEQITIVKNWLLKA